MSELSFPPFRWGSSSMGSVEATLCEPVPSCVVLLEGGALALLACGAVGAILEGDVVFN